MVFDFSECTLLAASIEFDDKGCYFRPQSRISNHRGNVQKDPPRAHARKW